MGFVHTAANHTIVSFLTGTVVPHASLFAWLIALGELGVGVSLLLGLFTRLDGFFAIVQAATYMLVAGGSGADTIGHNYMLNGGAPREQGMAHADTSPCFEAGRLP